MNIIKRLAERILQADIVRLDREITRINNEYLAIIEERDKTIVGLRTVIDNQKEDILKLRKELAKKPYFKRKKKQIKAK